MRTESFLLKKVTDVYDNNNEKDPKNFQYLHLPVVPGIILADDCHAIFKCPCGCEKDTQLWIYWGGEKPKTGHSWLASIDEELNITFSPSVYSTGFACRSHYFITKGKVVWA